MGWPVPSDSESLGKTREEFIGELKTDRAGHPPQSDVVETRCSVAETKACAI